MNTDAIVAQTIAAAFLKTNFDNQTSPNEVNEQDAWDEISNRAIEFLNWAEVDTKKIKIDKYSIAQAIWEMGKEELDEYLSKS